MLSAVFRKLAQAIPDGSYRAEPGAFALTTGVAIPTLNGVWVDSLDGGTGLVVELLDEVAATGLPHCLQARPAAANQVANLMRSRGMIPDDRIPLMVLEGPADLARPQQANSELKVRQLDPAHARLHAEIAAEGFEAPIEPFVRLMTPATLAADGVRCYVGEVDGEAVSTGIGVTIGPAVFICNIATPPDHRRRGYGAALTARAVADGLAAGATWSVLQSSPAGYAVYERLGFRTVEDWSCWLFDPTEF
jgi:N-acetylglutamate synthase